MDELEKLREKIDKLDKTIADLIYKRQSLSSEILKSKRGKFTYDPVREKKLMNKIFSYNINQKLAERIWRQIIGYNLSEQKKLKIGFIKNDRFFMGNGEFRAHSVLLFSHDLQLKSKYPAEFKTELIFGL